MANVVKVSMGRTIGVGKFEFVRLDFGYEMDVPPGESRGKTMAEAIKFVEKCSLVIMKG